MDHKIMLKNHKTLKKNSNDTFALLKTWHYRNTYYYGILIYYNGDRQNCRGNAMMTNVNYNYQSWIRRPNVENFHQNAIIINLKNKALNYTIMKLFFFRILTYLLAI